MNRVLHTKSMTHFPAVAVSVSIFFNRHPGVGALCKTVGRFLKLIYKRKFNDFFGF